MWQDQRQLEKRSIKYRNRSILPWFFGISDPLSESVDAYNKQIGNLDKRIQEKMEIVREVRIRMESEIIVLGRSKNPDDIAESKRLTLSMTNELLVKIQKDVNPLSEEKNIETKAFELANLSLIRTANQIAKIRTAFTGIIFLSIFIMFAVLLILN